jgi:hypothetical protein
MRRPVLALPALLTLTAILRAAPPPDYRGFSPGMEYRDFAARARALSAPDALRCNTSTKTAELMECGVMIVDPSDGAHLYLSAYVINGLVAMVSFGDSGDVHLVTEAQNDLVRRFGPAHPRGPGSWEWRVGRRVTRLSWVGRGPARWIYVNLSDYDLVDGISRYVKRAKS